MPIDKNRALELISESQTLKAIYEGSSEQLKSLFNQLIINSLPYSDNEHDKAAMYAKEMKETSFRLAKEYPRAKRKIQNYCMYTLVPKFNKVTIDLRTDEIPIQSTILGLRNRGNCFSGGFEWHRFSVASNEELEEAVKLIAEIYIS